MLIYVHMYTNVEFNAKLTVGYITDCY